jgi:hypothetical protein
MSILNNAKELAELIKKIGDIDLYRKIVELEGEILELTRQKREVDDKVEKLLDALSFKERLTFKSPVYFAAGDSTPYCPKCWEGQKLASHLAPPNVMKVLMWACPQCKAEFQIQPDPRHAQKEAVLQPQGAAQKPPEFVEHRGAIFKRKPNGGYFDDVLCRGCHNPMVSLMDEGPFRCQPCGISVNFNGHDLHRKILAELPQ